MNTIYWLINAYQLDSDYNHSVNFKNEDSQLNWFRGKCKYFIDDSMYQKKNEDIIVVDKNLQELKYCNYVIAINEDNTKYFYFIMDKQFNNDYSTTLYLKLDLIQTYLFKLNFTDSLIDREHKKRWVNVPWGKMPSDEILDEGLEVGEYEIKSINTIYDYADKGTYIFTSSDMVGVSDEKRVADSGSSGVGGVGGGSTTNFNNGYLNENGLVFLKSKEGFASTPYQDINGYWTTGYGITQSFQLNYYNKLIPSCTEQQASEVMGEVVFNFSSQVKNLCDSVGYKLNQDKLNALTSFAYQNGVGGMQNSTIWTAIKQNKSDDEIFNIWFSLGTYVNRRQQEANMFIGKYPNEMLISDVDKGEYLYDNYGKGYIPTNYR